MRSGDWPAVRAIYEQGIRDGATFALEPPSWKTWDADHTLRLVATSDSEVVGWAALSPVSSRHVYRGVARSSVYVAEQARGQGVGTSLLRALVESAEKAGIWTLEASLFPDNEASLRLHQAIGFRIVGIRERIGQRDGVWRDTVLLERRTP